MKSVQEIESNKKQAFDLTFSTRKSNNLAYSIRQANKFDMIVDTLPESFRLCERSAGYDHETAETDYSFAVKGYEQTNALVALIRRRMPGIEWTITRAYRGKDSWNNANPYYRDRAKAEKLKSYRSTHTSNKKA